MIRISTVYEQNEMKNRSLENKIDQYEHQMAKESQRNNENDRSKYEEFQRENE